MTQWCTNTITNLFIGDQILIVLIHYDQWLDNLLYNDHTLQSMYRLLRQQQLKWSFSVLFVR